MKAHSKPPAVAAHTGELPLWVPGHGYRGPHHSSPRSWPEVTTKEEWPWILGWLKSQTRHVLFEERRWGHRNRDRLLDGRRDLIHAMSRRNPERRRPCFPSSRWSHSTGSPTRTPSPLSHTCGPFPPYRIRPGQGPDIFREGPHHPWSHRSDGRDRKADPTPREIPLLSTDDILPITRRSAWIAIRPGVSRTAHSTRTASSQEAGSPSVLRG